MHCVQARNPQENRPVLHGVKSSSTPDAYIVKGIQAVDLSATGLRLKMSSRHFSAVVMCAVALFQSLSAHASNATYYFPRYWPENSPASVTIVGSGFKTSAMSSIGVSVGGVACAVIAIRSDSELVCTTSQTSGTGFSISYSFVAGAQAVTAFIPPRVVVELANELGIQTPPFGDAWKHSFLLPSAVVVFNLNCRLKDGKVIINELSGNYECSSIDISNWQRESLAYKFLYLSLPKALSLRDSECVLRVSSDALTAKLTVIFLKEPGSLPTSGGDVAARLLQQMFANGQFHMFFGRIINSMCTSLQRPRLLPSSILTSHLQGVLGQKNGPQTQRAGRDHARTAHFSHLSRRLGSSVLAASFFNLVPNAHQGSSTQTSEENQEG